MVERKHIPSMHFRVNNDGAERSEQRCKYYARGLERKRPSSAYARTVGPLWACRASCPREDAVRRKERNGHAQRGRSARCVRMRDSFSTLLLLT